jgi:hypothetical protein
MSVLGASLICNRPASFVTDSELESIFSARSAYVTVASASLDLPGDTDSHQEPSAMFTQTPVSRFRHPSIQTFESRSPPAGRARVRKGRNAFDLWQERARAAALNLTLTEDPPAQAVPR